MSIWSWMCNWCRVRDWWACKIRSGGIKLENLRISAGGHFLLAELPVHGFGSAPGNSHFAGDFLPHLIFKSGLPTRQWELCGLSGVMAKVCRLERLENWRKLQGEGSGR